MATIAVDIRSLQINQLTGVGIYAKESILALLKNDKTNNYLLFYSGFKPVNQNFLKNLSEFSNFSLIKIPWPNKILNFCLWIFNFPKFDYYIKADFFWFPNLNFWSLRKNIPYYITVHDLAFIKYPEFYSKKMRFWHKALWPKQKLREALKVIAVSENTKKDIVELIGMAEEKIKVIYSGLKIPVAEKNLDIKQKYNLPDKFLLYLGTLEPRKNIVSIISAFEKIMDNNCYLLIAGGRGWLYKKIEKRISASFKKEKIKLINYIKSEDAGVIYSLAQGLLWPSFYEGFGFPPLEAQEQGCNVITSANSSLPEVVKNSALLIDPHNTEELAQAIAQLINNDKLKQSLHAKAKENFNNYSWAEAAQTMIKLFNQDSY